MDEETKAKNIKYMNTWIKENYMPVGGSYPKSFCTGIQRCMQTIRCIAI